MLTGDHTLPDPTKWDGRFTAEDLELDRQMRAALGRLPGYAFEFLTDHTRLIDRVREHRPDLVFNLCDTGFRNLPTQELHVAALLEMLDVPYTGAPPRSMVLCYDKSIVRLVASSQGIATPGEVFVAPDAPIDGLTVDLPALVKPATADGSIGINRGSVVSTHAELRAQLAWFRSEFPRQAALVQEYLPGPEYGLGLIGNPATGLTVLPPLEVDFSALPAGLPPILAFESKTGPETAYDMVRIRRAQLPPERLAGMTTAATRLFERLHCRDVARFDFRTGGDGEVKLMEVNPNPAWSSAAKLAIMAGFAGLSYGQMLGMILASALARLRAASEAA